MTDPLYHLDLGQTGMNIRDGLLRVADAIRSANLQASTTLTPAAPVIVPFVPPTNQAMVNQVGVNIHSDYNDNDTYASASKIMAGLDYMGIKHIRTAAPNPNNQAQDKYAILARAGYKMLMICGQRPVADTVAAIAAIEQTYPGSIQGLEGPNEVNNGGGAGFGQGDSAGARAYTAALYGAVKSNPTLKNKEVWGYTDLTTPTGMCDIANFHYYPQNGMPPIDTLNGALLAMRMANPGKPLGVSEFGYDTANGGVSAPVTQQQQADYTIMAIKAHVAAGLVRTYIYEEFDTTNYGTSGGMFNDDGSPKLVATAVKALLVS